ncbi:hypothetical protein H0A61_02947 [Koleobacter methoxysyntrophicus]|uniref:Uncharacterized protein n=1 Tax=Koleobacter methoxysyntrophicus TaxID=2751313 RepID=A0A8A0RT91_9FIRM|nr:hypothetical protein [Koleobacter methoxysyntrophicus]QSQ10537.1 hypothetical protein H0A61_02947 [Koleobacter methoxysyntrophicus]
MRACIKDSREVCIDASGEEVVEITWIPQDYLGIIRETFAVVRSDFPFRETSKEKTIDARDRSTVWVRFPAKIRAFNESTVITIGNPIVQVYDKAKALLAGRTLAEAHDQSIVKALHRAEVIAGDNTVVIARDRSRIIAKGNAVVIAMDRASVTAYDNVKVYSASPETYIRVYDDARILSGIVKITGSEKDYLSRSLYLDESLQTGRRHKMLAKELIEDWICAEFKNLGVFPGNFGLKRQTKRRRSNWKTLFCGVIKTAALVLTFPILLFITARAALNGVMAEAARQTWL